MVKMLPIVECVKIETKAGCLTLKERLENCFMCIRKHATGKIHIQMFESLNPKQVSWDVIKEKA